jgi:manganese/zinc/iron transport system permease protein
MSLVSDAISHVLLLGIVLAFFLTHDLKSIWLILGAALTGVLTVALVEFLQRTGKIRSDAAIGLVFPALFSVGVILVSMNLRNTHLDVDRILLGIPELAPRRRIRYGNYDFGNYSFVLMSVVLLINVLILLLLYKEYKLSSFDPTLAAALGFAPAWLHYGLMTMTSLTAVTAFDAVGPVLVIAFMIVPAATAWLLVDRLSWMLVVSAVLASVGAILGTHLAARLNTNIPGTVSVTLGMLFTVAFFVAPQRGVLVVLLRRRRQRRELFQRLLVVHLHQHEGTPQEPEESRLSGLHQHFRWKPEQLRKVIDMAHRNGWIIEEQGHLRLTPLGRESIREWF